MANSQVLFRASLRAGTGDLGVVVGNLSSESRLGGARPGFPSSRCNLSGTRTRQTVKLSVAAWVADRAQSRVSSSQGVSVLKARGGGDLRGMFRNREAMAT